MKIKLILQILFFFLFLIGNAKALKDKYTAFINPDTNSKKNINMINLMKRNKLFLERIIESAKFSNLTSAEVMSIYNDVEFIDSTLTKMKNVLTDVVILSQISEAILSVRSAKMILIRLRDKIISKSYSGIYRELILLEENIYEIEIYLTGLSFKKVLSP